MGIIFAVTIISVFTFTDYFVSIFVVFLVILVINYALLVFVVF